MTDQIDARELKRDILPKLKATRHLVENTLTARIERCQDEAERRRLTTVRQKFEWK
ncbi:hypothetical protein LWH48_03165 [Halomonas sp. G15]|uniref:hypothetical protein n=1 Tax=Halomonas sp. G15 TaxID=2903521 RepID=UPI001E55859B|nr:hypothetical protein [Halomonas sp. G15]MCE0731804.1 hypothetical protein [Halomonas sp. G15]